jgi:hypothetical protein
VGVGVDVIASVLVGKVGVNVGEGLGVGEGLVCSLCF